MTTEHFEKLQNMYLQANVNRQLYESTTVSIREGLATIGLTIEPKYFHALGAIHGSVYFKLLDDAAFFAVNSMVTNVCLLTTSFNINLVRPANAGTLKAEGTVKFASRDVFVAEAVLFDQKGREIAFGTGNFAKSRIDLSPEIGYK